MTRQQKLKTARCQCRKVRLYFISLLRHNEEPHWLLSLCFHNFQTFACQNYETNEKVNIEKENIVNSGTTEGGNTSRFKSQTEITIQVFFV